MRLLFFISLLFVYAGSEAQVNFVLNPDFELYSQCPTGGSMDNAGDALYWSAVDSINVNTCVPEYCNACLTTCCWTVPAGGEYFQYAHSGNAFIHGYIYCKAPDTQGFLRDYLQGRLYTNLTAGKSYCVSFYTCLSEGSRFAIDKIGAYLDDGSIDTNTNCNVPLTTYVPQVQNTLGVIQDTLNWTKIEGSFIATGHERFITIGNFFSVYNTDTIRLEDNFYNFPINDVYGYYIFDDVSVIETDLEAYAGPDTWVVEGDSVFIGRTPEVGLECKWLVNGSVIDSGAGIWVHPLFNTTYVVEQTICGLTKTDTVMVEVWPVGINGITNGQQVSIYPNPATDELHIKSDKLIFSAVSVTDGLGRDVIRQFLTGKETVLDIKNLVSGVYSIVLEGESGREMRRFVKY